MTARVETRARRVLVIEDESDIRDLLTYNLEAGGYAVAAAETGTTGLSLFETFLPDVVVLDLMLPDVPGTEVCRRIRARAAGDEPRIIMVTAKGEEIDRVVGFEVGADDYVVKPFSIRELLLRIRALLRERSPTSPQIAVRDVQDANGDARVPSLSSTRSRQRYAMGPLTVDVEGHHVFVDGDEVHVSAIEMRLLVYLIDHRGRVRSREDLLEDVWGYRPGVSTRTVDTHVKRLRDKLAGAAALIETVRGAGYRLADKYPVVVEPRH